MHAATTDLSLLAKARRPATAALILLALIAAAIAAYCVIVRLTGNIHTVEDGKFYRSAELDKSGFEHVIRRYGIKSILNLRGANPDRAWYIDEIDASSALDVEHYDYGISANHVVTSRQIDDILNVLRTAPQPILVHCEGGADRTGLISALYLTRIEGVAPDKASEQLSLAYGHFPYLFSRTGAMDESFRDYVRNAHPDQ